MRRIFVLSTVILAGPGFQPAWADMHANISGAAPVLPSVFIRHERQLDERRPPPPVVTILKARPTSVRDVNDGDQKPVIALPKPGIVVPLNTIATAPAIAPPTLLFDRRLGKADKEAELPPDLLDAILRIEGIYDPTRVDVIDDAPRMEVRAGTAIMNNVFADRWRRDDSDPNVHVRVRYLAQAWMRKPDAGCDAFYKRRSSVQGFALTGLSAEDCARLKQLQDADDSQWTPARLTEARISVPVFAAPLPGARLSSSDFWAAQRAKIAAVSARLKDKWQITSTGPTH